MTAEELARRIREAAGEWDDKELPVQMIVSNMRDAARFQGQQIEYLRAENKVLREFIREGE